MKTAIENEPRAVLLGVGTQHLLDVTKGHPCEACTHGRSIINENSRRCTENAQRLMYAGLIIPLHEILGTRHASDF